MPLSRGWREHVAEFSLQTSMTPERAVDRSAHPSRPLPPSPAQPSGAALCVAFVVAVEGVVRVSLIRNTKRPPVWRGPRGAGLLDHVMTLLDVPRDAAKGCVALLIDIIALLISIESIIIGINRRAPRRRQGVRPLDTTRIPELRRRSGRRRQGGRGGGCVLWARVAGVAVICTIYKYALYINMHCIEICTVYKYALYINMHYI